MSAFPNPDMKSAPLSRAAGLGTGRLSLPGPGGFKEIEFQVHGGSGRITPAVWAACHLIPCMARGIPLKLPAPLDAKLSARLPLLMDRLAAWNQKLRAVEVVVPNGNTLPATPAPKSSRVGACFTGGVDSFYTLLTRNQEIDTLVYVLGYDVQRRQEKLWQQTHEMLKAVAAHYGKRLIVVETNLRRFLDPALPWAMTHGTALAAAGHVVEEEIGRLIIPSSYIQSQAHLSWGSHPDLDPLWSSERMEIVHDTLEAPRLVKLRRIAEDDAALRFLRVCYENEDDAYNCGHCAKCFRTMAELEALGALERAATFPKALNLAAAARCDLGDETDGIFFREILEDLKRTGRAPELAAFLARLPSVQRAAGRPFSLMRHENVRRREALVVRACTVEVSASETILTAPVEWGELRTRLEVRLNVGGKAPRAPGDALLLWFLLPAMRNGVPLILEDAVSEELLDGIERAQMIWSTHIAYEGHTRVKIRAPSLPQDVTFDPSEDQRPWGAAFSSGVDAMFTALTAQDRIGHLLWVEGIDTEALDDTERLKVRGWIQSAAQLFGKPLIVAQTNLRRVLQRDLGGSWQMMYVMAVYGMAQLLEPHLSRLLVASENSYREQLASPKHLNYNPALDPCVSTDRVRLKVHGSTHTRLQRVEALVKRPEILNHLVVCGQRAMKGYGGGRNCGKCEKCQRTLAAIRMAGGAHPAEAFDHPLDFELLQSAGSTMDELRVRFHEYMLDEVERRGTDPELAGALKETLRRAERRLGKSGTGAVTASPWDQARSSPEWPNVVKKHANELAAAVFADKPSARLRGVMHHAPKSGLLANGLLRALLKEDGRAKLMRRAVARSFGGSTMENGG